MQANVDSIIWESIGFLKWYINDGQITASLFFCLTKARVFTALESSNIENMWRMIPMKSAIIDTMDLNWNITHIHLGPLLLTWFNFNPSMDK